MASSTPYDPDDAIEHNPFANESSPFAEDVTSNNGDNIYGETLNHDDSTTASSSAVEGQDITAPTSASEESTVIQASSHDRVDDAVSNEAQQKPLQSDNTTVTSKASPRPIAPRRQLKKYKLVTKVTAIERQGKKDPIIRFDAYTTLPRFRTTTFRDIRRTHNEFIKFFEHLNGANPECFVPSVPPATSSFGAGTGDDESIIKQKIQTWLDRVCGNPILARDEEMVYFIEADFGYSPVVKRKPPATGLARKAMKQFQPPPDEVTELMEFRPLIKHMYQLSSEAHMKVEKMAKIRRTLGVSLNEFGTKTGMLSNLEAHQGVINMWRKMGKTLTLLGDLELIKATSISSSFGDGIEQISNDAYVAKEALTNRHLLMRELSKAQANTRSKHQVAIRVKGSANLSPLKVDEAINALEDATHVEEQLTNKVRRVSENMLIDKGALLKNMEQDIQAFVKEYVLREIDSDRRALSSWESIRADVRAVDANGGLSRLGRESTPSSRRAAIAQSQSLAGDSWSGDRNIRAVDSTPQKSSYSVSEGETLDEDDDESETIMDAKNAASLLAGSTF